jgi:hypothetical protein
MMLAMLAWCGFRLVKSDTRVKVQAFSRLAGCHVGSVWLSPPRLTTLVETIKDLQAQASLLLKHAKRTPNYMVLVLDGVELPRLTYRNTMTQVEEGRALRSLQGATNNSKIELSWDEDDLQALGVLESECDYLVLQRRSTVCKALRLKLQGKPLPEVQVLAYLSVMDGLSTVDILFLANQIPDLDFILSFPSVTTLRLSFATIASWDFVAKLNLTHLVLTACKIQASTTTTMVEFPNLRELCLM